MRALDGVEVLHVSDRTFLMHLGGKIEIQSKIPLKTRDDLSMAYTPGVARISEAVADDPESAWNLTIKQNTVAVVSDGTAVLGLGDIGPEAAMPVMEGKALLFKEFGGDRRLADLPGDEGPGRDRRRLQGDRARASAASTSRTSRRLAASRSRHGSTPSSTSRSSTTTSTGPRSSSSPRSSTRSRSSASASRTSPSSPPAVGAAGVATTDALLAAGARTIVGCDHEGAVYPGRPGLPPHKAEYALRTNPDALRCSADEALAGADVFIGLSVAGRGHAEGIRRMAKDAIVFAMANPTPEVEPEAIHDVAAVVATGRSDYPNQINNVLAFPGVFRGALDVRASTITAEMKVAAAHAIASVIPKDELGPEYVIPSVFNRDVTPRVAAEVAAAAEAAGVARHPRHRASTWEEPMSEKEPIEEAAAEDAEPDLGAHRRVGGAGARAGSGRTRDRGDRACAGARAGDGAAGSGRAAGHARAPSPRAQPRRSRHRGRLRRARASTSASTPS